MTKFEMAVLAGDTQTIAELTPTLEAAENERRRLRKLILQHEADQAHGVATQPDGTLPRLAQ